MLKSFQGSVCPFHGQNSHEFFHTFTVSAFLPFPNATTSILDISIFNGKYFRECFHARIRSNENTVEDSPVIEHRSNVWITEVLVYVTVDIVASRFMSSICVQIIILISCHRVGEIFHAAWSDGIRWKQRYRFLYRFPSLIFNRASKKI